MNIKAIIITLIMLAACLFLIQQQVGCSRSTNVEVAERIEPQPPADTKTDTPPPANPSVVEVDKFPGWKSDGTENGKEWFTLKNPSAPTGWISLERRNTSFRNHQLCIKDFKSRKDGTITSFKIDPKLKSMYQQKADLSFETTPISKEEYCQIGHASTAFQYRPYENIPLDISFTQVR